MAPMNIQIGRLASKPCSEATNIGYRFSSRAVFGWILIELNSGCGDLGERVEIFCLLQYNIVKSNHPPYFQSFSSKQKTSASVPKSSHLLFNSPSPATAQKPLPPNKAYLWSRSKCWMRVRGANIQRAATKITNMPYWGAMASSVVRLMN